MPTGKEGRAGAQSFPRASPDSNIPARLSFGLVDGRPVFVDLREDSYFMLEPDEGPGFHNPSNPSDCPPGEAAAASREVPADPVACARPRRSVLEDAGDGFARIRLTDIIAVWQLTVRARSKLRRRPIADILASASEAGPIRQGLGVGTEILAMRFAAARRLVPVSGHCLTDSLALLEWLRTHGCGAMLVLGVKLDPFAAHCWVQTEELLLNDRAERVERFTPVGTIPCAPVTL